MKNFTAIFEAVQEGGYICWIEEMPNAMSQGETIEEAKTNLIDALKLLMEANREQAELNLQGKNIIRGIIPLMAI